MDGKFNLNTTGEKHNFELCFMFYCFVREVATQHKVMLSRDTSERLFGYIRSEARSVFEEFPLLIGPSIACAC